MPDCAASGGVMSDNRVRGTLNQPSDTKQDELYKLLNTACRFNKILLKI